MIDLNDFSPEEIDEMEQKIAEYRRSEKNLKGYKITFYVRYNPSLHESDYLGDVDSLYDWLYDTISDNFERGYGLSAPETVDGFNVEVMTSSEVKKIWATFDN